MAFAQLALPLMCAPMSFASSVDLAVACRKAGIADEADGPARLALLEARR
jgi:hypothetical protein